MKLINQKSAIAFVLAGLLSGTALAATQGVLGSTSSGNINISAAKASAVMISGLADMVFGSSNSTPAPAIQTACIYSTTGSYTIQANSANAGGGNYRLKDTGANFINYTIGWSNVTTGGTFTPMNLGGASASLTGANTTSQTCNATSNARFQVTIDSNTYASAPSGAYSDTLTLVLAPV